MRLYIAEKPSMGREIAKCLRGPVQRILLNALDSLSRRRSRTKAASRSPSNIEYKVYRLLAHFER